MPTTDLLMGARVEVPSTTVGITADATPEDLVFAGGTYYLDHPTPALSLLTAWANLLNTHSLVSDAAAVLTRSARVRTTSSEPIAITDWGANTTLRDMLGFTAIVGLGSNHVSPALSSHIWVPGKPGSSRARLGSDGVLNKDTYSGRAAPGLVYSTENNSWRTNEFWWNYVDVDRVETVPDSPGTWATFWDNVVSQHQAINLYRGLDYDPTDEVTTLDLSAGRLPASDTYFPDNGSPMVRTHNRQIEHLEKFCRVELQVTTGTEVS